MTDLKPVRDALDDFTTATTRVARGTLAGFIGGAIASWMMNQYQAAEANAVVNRQDDQQQATRGRKSKQAEKTASNDDATVKTAQRVSRALFDHELNSNEKKLAGPAVHYGYGAAVGALYGGLAELLPTVGVGLGIPYATLLWLLGDEVAVPALHLSKPATKTPVSAHASALATHFVYGISLDIGRRILRHII